MVDINALIAAQGGDPGWDIGNALTQGLEKGRIRNALIQAGMMAQGGQYGPAANALIQAGQVGPGIDLLQSSDPNLVGGKEQFGLNPVMLEGPGGVQIPYQLSNRGGGRQVQLPQGTRLSPKWHYVTTPEGIRAVPAQGSAEQPGAGAAPNVPINPEAEPAAKARVEQRGKLPSLKLAFQTVDDNLNETQRQVRSLITDPGLKGIYGISGAFPDIPGGKAAGARTRLQTLKSRLSIDQLQAIREASKTGGALGNVSNQDTSLLETAAANLQNAQSVDDAVAALKVIDGILTKSKARRKQAYDEEVALAGQTALGTAEPSPDDGKARPQSRAEFDALISGTPYVLPDGRSGVK